MSVLGIDFGQTRCFASAVGEEEYGVMNEPYCTDLVSDAYFLEGLLFVGSDGSGLIKPNQKIISQIKRLIGRSFSDPELRQDLMSLAFVFDLGTNGVPLIRAQYGSQIHPFTPCQLMRIAFSNMKAFAEKALHTRVVDCCIAIPIYFTDLQRRACVDAATIAGLNPCRLMHETTAAALGSSLHGKYGPLKGVGKVKVAVVDIGHASMQVCIAVVDIAVFKKDRKKDRLKVLAHSFDRCLGGRDFDEVLFQHFVEKFKLEYKIDVMQNARACSRLLAECENLKKVLSERDEAPMNIEYFMQEKSVSGKIKRDEFEKISAPILERVKKPLEKALAEAQLTVDDVKFVNVIGSGSRVPAVMKTLTRFFSKEAILRMTSDMVSLGCTSDCGTLSPSFSFKELRVEEIFPFSVALKWKGMAQDSQHGTVEDHQSIVFPKGNPIPSEKALTFVTDGTFSVDLEYTNVSGLKALTIGTYMVGPFQATNATKVKVKASLNLHGIVSLDSAQLSEGNIEVPVTKEPSREETKMDTDMASADVPSREETKMDTDIASAHVPSMNETKMDSAQVESPKKKVQNSNIPVIEVAHVQQAVQDCVIEETKAKKNALEAYVYDMRDKLYDKLFEFVTDSERVQFIAKLQETEDWLHEDREDETKGVYVAKLDELKQQGDPIEERYKARVIEETNARRDEVLAYLDDMRDKLRDKLFEFVTDSDRDKLTAKLKKTKDWLYRDGVKRTKREYIAKLDELKKLGDPVENRYKEYFEIRSSMGRLAICINSLKSSVRDPKYEHTGGKEKVLKECEEAKTWLKLVCELQMKLPKHKELGVLSADISKREEELNRVCTQILSTGIASVDVPSTNVTDVNMEDAPESAGDNAVKMEIDTKTMSRSPSRRARVLREEIEHLINESMTESFSELLDEIPLSDVIPYCITVKGEALEKYGDDYQCPNVMDICEKLREENPDFFWKRGTKEIAKVIMMNLRKSKMIQQVSIRGGCFISFKLSWEWMAKRIQMMVDDGIHTWAPMFSIKTALIEVPTPARDSNMYADHIRSQYIRDMLARMLEYCGIDVLYRVSNRSFDEQSQREIEHKFSVEHGEFKKRVCGRTAPTPLFVWRRERRTEKRKYDNVRIDLGNLWSGVHLYQADLMVYITPTRQRGYIEECINAARDVNWLDSVTACCCGYQTSYNEKEKLARLTDEIRNYSKAASLAELGPDGCTPEAVFECALRYTYLRNHRLVDCRFSSEEMLDGKGNTFVYLLNTLALVYSSMKNPGREMCKLKKEVVAKERDLALHLVRFSDVVEDSCAKFLPHFMCEYLYDLCKKFSSCYSEVPPVATKLMLCKATAIVIEKCFHLLNITPASFRDQQPLQRFLSSPDEATLVNHFIPLPRSVVPPRLETSRFEMLSMFVSLEDTGFEEGDMFGSITINDVYGLHPDVWSYVSRDDFGFVPYFERHWYNPMHIKDDSLIFFGNPSSRHAVAFASCIDIHACLMVTSLGTGNRKDRCYTICETESKIDKNLEKFWQGEKQVQCDSVCFKSNDGALKIYYILMRDAIDVTIKMRYVLTIPVVVRGYVHAYYDGVANEVDDNEQMCYKSVVFKTNHTRIKAGDTLDLSKSVVAVPANGRLVIDVFMQDVKSGKIILEEKFSYSARPKASINRTMPSKPGTKGTFILTLNWSKGLIEGTSCGSS